MEQILKHLEKIRRLRLCTYIFAVFVFSLILIFNQWFVKSGWLSSIIIFDSVLLFLLVITFIEVKIGYKYDEMYHTSFLPLLLKDINPTYEYMKNPENIDFNLADAKIFDYSSEMNINSVLSFNKLGENYKIYDINVYLKTYRERKVYQFKGYVLSIINKLEYQEDTLILYKKRPHIGQYKLVKEIGVEKYRVFQRNVTKVNMDCIKELLTREYRKDKNNVFQIIINKNIMIFTPYKRSFYRKPIFRKINDKFVENKRKEFNNLNSIIDDFIQCFKKMR